MPRSIADQTVEELGGPTSVLARQRRDHQEIDRLLHDLAATTGGTQEAVLRRINRLVFSHAFAEETVLWPVLRRVMPDGDALTLRVEEEHQEVNELVADLEILDHNHPNRYERLSRLIEVLRQDVRDEEDVLLPRLQEQLDATQLRRLGMQWQVARRLSPTRPHPTVSRRPPGNARSGVPLSVLDRSRDLVDHAPGPLRSLGRSASRGLAALAGLIEKLPRPGPAKEHRPAATSGHRSARPGDATRPRSCPRVRQQSASGRSTVPLPPVAARSAADRRAPPG